MKKVLRVGVDDIKIRLDLDEHIIEIYLDEDNIPIKYPYNDITDVIDILERYTVLYQDDIEQLMGVC